MSDFLHSIKKLHDNLKKVYKKHTPLVIKIAPDITVDVVNDIVKLTKEYDIDGIICTNTTIDKSGVSSKYRDIQGGLSGKPLLKKSNDVLFNVSEKLEKDKTIIGVGGIDSWESANQKFNLGADLLQVYTGMVYKGPNLLREILKD